MKMLKNCLFSTIIICGLLVITNAQVPNNNFSQLRFSIETTKNWFVLSEQIPFVLKVRNETNSMIGGGLDFSARAKRIRFLVEKPDKSVVEVEHYQMYSGTCAGCKTKFPLLPNITFQNRDAIQNFVETTFSEEGDYKVWAEICEKECYQANTQKVSSNRIEFKVYEPKGKDAEAYQMFKELLKYDWYFSNKKDETYLQIAENFLSKYEGSPYSDYVASKAVEYFAQIKQTQKADAYYQKISVQYPLKMNVLKQRKKIEFDLQEE